MSEENKTIELKEEELEKVTGGDEDEYDVLLRECHKLFAAIKCKNNPNYIDDVNNAKRDAMKLAKRLSGISNNHYYDLLVKNINFLHSTYLNVVLGLSTEIEQEPVTY